MSIQLTDAQREVLAILADQHGVVYLRGADAEAARSLAATDLVALGPDGAWGSIAAALTDEGRAALLAELLKPEGRQ